MILENEVDEAGNAPTQFRLNFAKFVLDSGSNQAQWPMRSTNSDLNGEIMVHMNPREFSRIGIDLHVILNLKHGITVEGSANDVSLKGVFLLSEQRADLGSACAVTMLFGDKETGLLELVAEGIVVRHETDGMAVEFTSLDLDTYDHLRNLILAHTTDSDSMRDEIDQHLGLKKRPASTKNQGEN